MKTHLFRAECLTDMHVGNGEANYSIINNEVQKDTVLQDVPIIHASGVKGALKDHFERLGWTEDKIRKVFGGSCKDKDGKAITAEGSYKFFTALCIARPLRVTDGTAPYVLATSNSILDHFSSLLKGLGRNDIYDKGRDSLRDGINIEVEGETVATKNSDALKALIGENFAVLDNLQDYALPVRARNVLDEKGQSENIWYEELVPHKSIFCFAVATPDDECELAFEEGRPVQFGGNASIGNGYTAIREVLSA